MAQSLVTQVSQDPVAQGPEEDIDSCCCPCWWSFCCCSYGTAHQGAGHSDVQFADCGDTGARYLLPEIPEGQKRRKCLVLDLDETLVHSSFKPIPDADFKIEIELEGTIHRVYVRKRPFVDEFMKHVGKGWEVVIFTASLSKYADPLLDILDRDKVVTTRLFRPNCVQHYGNYVKDLSHLGRPLHEIVIIDNNPFAYMFQPDNAIPITSWFNDRTDTQLHDLLPFLDGLLEANDIPEILQRKEFPFLQGDNNLVDE